MSRSSVYGVKAQLGAGLTEAGAQLGRRVDGEVEDLARFEELLGGGEDLGVLPYGWPEFLLEVTDEEAWVSEAALRACMGHCFNSIQMKVEESTN